ncbi:tRNA (Guanine-N(1)-)-methyltransferase [gamma proteobacterium HdN1]|nr:tRNA (Guanine-N(1)-)-methyltransferase [gamma proteobacterium HdN1]
MRIGVVTLFPELVAAVTQSGITGRAVKRGLLQVNCINPRDFTVDVHRTVDDRPYGGGPGMVMLPEPMLQTIAAASQWAGADARKPKVIYMSPQGSPFTHAKAQSLAEEGAVVLVAGRYEGIDERIIELGIDEEWSMGDYVLSGGELPAMTVIDAVARLLPGALGHSQSAQEDSFTEGLLDCPHYTRPEVYEGRPVPAVLLSGNHEAIRRWRLKQALGRTWLRRPDLLEKKSLTAEDKRLLEAFLEERLQK